MDEGERSAVLVVRVWREAGAEPGDVRARVTMTSNADEAGSHETAAAGAEEIIGLVRSWLSEFVSA